MAEPINAPNFTTSPENFHEGYYAYAVKNAVIYLEPNELSRKIGSVPIYDQVIVSEVSGEWCLARYEDTCGFIRTSSLFQVGPYRPLRGRDSRTGHHALPGLCQSYHHHLQHGG